MVFICLFYFPLTHSSIPTSLINIPRSSPRGLATTIAVIIGPIDPEPPQRPTHTPTAPVITRKRTHPLTGRGTRSTKDGQQNSIWSFCGDARITGRQHLPIRATPQHTCPRQHISSRPITPPHEGCPHTTLMVVLLLDVHSNPHDRPSHERQAGIRQADDLRGLTSRTSRLAGLRPLLLATSRRQPLIALEHTLPSTSRHNNPREHHG